ncbi:hypothetical protein [Streptomyces sp. 2112.3]|nr:hypothetical protein [Streptomyces sp. 2112.3]
MDVDTTSLEDYCFVSLVVIPAVELLVGSQPTDPAFSEGARTGKNPLWP